MKAIDVVNKLAQKMPLYSSDFTESVNILSITPTGSVATVVTDVPHGLQVGQYVAINGVDTPIQIDTMIRTGTFLTVTTLQDHDLTLSKRDKDNGGKTVNIAGATETEFNGQFDLIGVDNRRTFILAVDDSGATTATGTPVLLDGSAMTYGGYREVTGIGGDTSFLYQLDDAMTLSTTGGTVSTSIRIAGCLDIERYVRDIYTKKGLGEDTLVVQLGDVTRSKNKNETTDATDSVKGQQMYEPTFIHSFAVYIIQNSTQDLDGHKLRDKVESVHVPAIIRSLETVVFDTGFGNSEYGAACTNHGVYVFEEITSQKSALYVHELVFEQVSKLDSCLDLDRMPSSVAMRDIALTVCLSTGNNILEQGVNLDEKPIQ